MEQCYVYILELKNGKYNEHGKFYIGYTTDLKKRIEYHLLNMSRGTADKEPKLVFWEKHFSHKAAKHREAQLKKYPLRTIVSVISEFREHLNLVGVSSS